MNLTHENITLGMPVMYEYYSPESGATVKNKLHTQVISSPQKRHGMWCVLVAMVGDWVPISQLKHCN